MAGSNVGHIVDAQAPVIPLGVPVNPGKHVKTGLPPNGSEELHADALAGRVEGQTHPFDAPVNPDAHVYIPVPLISVHDAN